MGEVTPSVGCSQVIGCPIVLRDFSEKYANTIDHMPTSVFLSITNRHLPVGIQIFNIKTDRQVLVADPSFLNNYLAQLDSVLL